MTTKKTRIPPTSCRRGRGFSLAETMIAIGILGIGMAMSASVFPAALKEAQRTTNTQVGMMICENALTMARCILRKGDVLKVDVPTAANPAMRWIQETDVLNGVTYRTRFGGGFVYPVSDTTGLNKFAFGYLLFGKFKTDDLRTLMAVAYRKTADTNTVSAVLVSGVNYTTGNKRFSLPSASGNLRTGTTIIDAITGDYAVVLSGDGQNGLLDRTTFNTVTNGGVWVVVEKNASSVVQELSPAIAILSLDVGLRD